MVKTSRFVAAATLLLCAAVQAAEKPSPEYAALMKDAGNASRGVRQAIDANDFDGVSSSAAKLETILAATEKFWAKRKSEDGVQFAKAGVVAATDLKTGAAARDAARVKAANTALTASCSGCHAAHRERLDEGSYGLK